MNLTKRQREVAALVGQRLSCVEIAERLGCQVATVHAHVLMVAEKIRAAEPDALYMPAMKQVRRWAMIHGEQAA